MKTLFIVNPRSGRALRARDEVAAFAAQHGARLAFTERPRHATELATRALADGCERVVAVGGDGTLNEVAAVLVGTPATFGLVPCGSGNGLGRHLGIHGSVARSLAIIATGATRLIDTGLADGHPFFTAAGLGFEVEISERFNRLARRGFVRYLRTSAQAFRDYQPQDYIVEHAGARTPFRAFTLAVGNSDQYGNNARIAPGARVDDGLLDLTAIPPVTLRNGVPLLWRLFRGLLDRDATVLCRRAAAFTVERPGPGPIHTDGELHAAPARVTFAVRPASLRILAPDAATVH
ncbi:MAG: diacylglycerol kinase family lipid kinase [Verrucomicrobia bacterium]|nr:diacylglycerol kinase family lipid kinase [Verrucomicrobiota bacterium]